jgi:TPR repeat protein
MNNYGTCLIEGKGVSKDPEEGVVYFVMSHSLGNLHGTSQVIYCILFGKGTYHLPEVAYSMWKELPIQTFNLAFYTFGLFFIEGTIFGKSYSKSFEFFDLLTDKSKLEVCNLNEIISGYLQMMVFPDSEFLKKMDLYRIKQNGKEIKVFEEKKKKLREIHLYIETFCLRNFASKSNSSKREHYIKILTQYQRNPTNMSVCIELAILYFKGIGTDKNRSKAKLLFHRAHSKKSDDGTFGLLTCMKKSKETKESRFQICLEWKDTKNPKLLYRIGKGLTERNHENQSKFNEGISFLEKAVFKLYPKATLYLCLSLLKYRFGFDKNPNELYLMSSELKESESIDECVYFGVCLFLGIGREIDKKEDCILLTKQQIDFQKLVIIFNKF